MRAVRLYGCLRGISQRATGGIPERRHAARRGIGYPLLLGMIGVLVLAAALVLAHARSKSSTPTGVKPPANALASKPKTVIADATAPDFEAKSARGGNYHLSAMKDKVILLSFIETQAPNDSPEAQPSRAQIAFIKSMYKQYSPRGLVSILVDASRVRSGKISDQTAVYNLTFNWNLADDLAVINDDAPDSIAARYQVTELPTTFLIAKDNRINKRWDGVASTPNLAHAIQELLGKPVVTYPTGPAVEQHEKRPPKEISPGQHPRIVPPSR